MLSVDEVENYLSRDGNYDYDDDDYCDDGGWGEFYNSKLPFNIAGMGEVYVVEDVGGEDEGSHRHLVFKWTDPDGDTVRYFKKLGYYASYDGSTWDGDFSEVKPVEKTITVYE